MEKWRARPHLDSHAGLFSQEVVGRDGDSPCFFVVPKTAIDPPAGSGTVGDCVDLVPDGRRLDLFEVELWSGTFIPIVTDDYLQDTISLAFTRIVYPLDDWARRFHVFLRHVYDPYMSGSRNPYTYIDWLLPDSQVYYRRVSTGSGYSDAVFENEAHSPIFAWSRINWNGDGWDLALQNGTTYLSPEAYRATRPQQGSLVAIFDEKGNEVQLSRKFNGDLTQIKSPGKRFITLAYDAQGAVTQLKDSDGNVVRYKYDATDRLVSVMYPNGRRIEYSYNSANQIVGVEDSADSSVVKIAYDALNRVAQETLSNGSSYSFRYGPLQNGMNTWVEIAGPQSETVRVTLTGDSYSVSGIQASKARILP